MRPTFFATPSAFRAWFETHHEKAAELLVGFYKRGTGRPSITWPESVDEALCFERTSAAKLSPAQEKALRADRKAAAFFDAQPPWYRRAAIHWVISANREETRDRRFAQLISDSARGRTIGPLTRPSRGDGTAPAPPRRGRNPKQARSARR
jgi:uncharacterized protein YdeI (YjbR/CyaY-like superfamily)